MFQHSELVENLDSLRKFAYRLTGNMTDAEDLLQATALRALEKKHLFTPGTNLLKWASKVMFNLFVTDYRRKVKFETQYDPEGVIERQSIEAPQDKQFELSRIGDAMKKLSPEHRKVLVLVCIKGLKYEEVANFLSIPVGTVRSRLARARESLQYILDSRSGKETFVPPHKRENSTYIRA